MAKIGLKAFSRTAQNTALEIIDAIPGMDAGEIGSDKFEATVDRMIRDSWNQSETKQAVYTAFVEAVYDRLAAEG